MNYGCVGVSSASKASTYHENKTNAQIDYPNGFYAMSKAELRKAYEFQSLENQKLRQEVMRLKNKLLIRQAEMINQEGKDYIPQPTTFLRAV